MSKLEYSVVQIQEIESNKYIEKCTSKQIRFTNECKIEVLKLADKGMFHREVFHKLLFVHDSLKDLEKYDLKGALIHSDQGFHYTHPSFKKGVEKLGCIESMSKRGNCIDNSPTESFFGHMKDEIDISECNTLETVKKYMNKYMFEYNNNRPQWNRKKMTPVQYRNHFLND